MVWNASGVHDFYDPPTDWTPLATTAAYSIPDNLGKSYSYSKAIENAEWLGKAAANSAMTKYQGIEDGSLLTGIGGLTNTVGSFVGAGLAKDLFGGGGKDPLRVNDGAELIGKSAVGGSPFSDGWTGRIFG